jgi:hypothetical protein
VNEAMLRASERISSMIGGATTPADVRKVVYKMLQDGTAEPAVIKSVAVGLEMALDILAEEATRESSGTG